MILEEKRKRIKCHLELMIKVRSGCVRDGKVSLC